MTSKKHLAIVMTIAALFAIPATVGLSYAAEHEGIDEGLLIGGELAVLGTGALAGVVLSVSRVIGKHVKGKGEPIDPHRLGVNIVVGAGLGYLLVTLGIEPEAAIGAHLLALYLVNQFLVPVFGSWIKNKGGSGSTAPAKSF